LGSHLCEYCVEKGHEVFCMDNILTGNRENILYLIGHEGFTFIKYDVTEFIYVPGHLDYILHFTSPAIPISPRLKPF